MLDSPCYTFVTDGPFLQQPFYIATQIINIAFFINYRINGVSKIIMLLENEYLLS